MAFPPCVDEVAAELVMFVLPTWTSDAGNSLELDCWTPAAVGSAEPPAAGVPAEGAGLGCGKRLCRSAMACGEMNVPV